MPTRRFRRARARLLEVVLVAAASAPNEWLIAQEPLALRSATRGLALIDSAMAATNGGTSGASSSSRT